MEGWDSYEYIIATKQQSDIDAIDVDALVAEGPIDDYRAELDEIKTIREAYYNKCKKFLDLQSEYKDDPAALIDRLRSDHADFKWGWLGGAPEDVVERSAKEARLFLDEYEQGRVQ